MIGIKAEDEYCISELEEGFFASKVDDEGDDDDDTNACEIGGNGGSDEELDLGGRTTLPEDDEATAFPSKH